MTKFRVPIVIEFYGEVEVDAETEEAAEDIACSSMNGTITAHDTGNESLIDFSVERFGHTTRDYQRNIETLEKREE